MGYILFWVIVSILIAAFTALASTEGKVKENAVAAAMVMVIVSIAFVAIFPVFSYFNTVGAYGQKARIEQRQTALALYVKHANVPSGVEGNVISDLTDKKYEGYQDNLDYIVRELRNLIEAYNDTVAEKRIMQQGFLFGMLVHCPEDLKIVKMLQ